MRKVRVRKRPDSPQFQLYVWDGLTQKYLTRSAGTDKPKEAERAAALWEQELGKGGASGVVSWVQFRERFQDEYLSSYPRSTQDSYLKALRSFEREVGKPSRLNEITPSVLSKYKGDLIAKGLSPATVAGYLRHLLVAFGWAKELRLMAEVPTIRLPKGGAGSAKRRPLTFAEVSSIADAARELFPDQGEMIARLLWLVWFTGLRLGEARVLSWDSGPIIVSLEPPYPRLIFAAASQKSGNEEEIPITKQAAEWFRAMPDKDGLVCPIHFGKQQAGVDLLSHKISEAATKAGLSAGAHDIRRSFATRMAKEINPYSLQRLMRHSSITTTLRYYIGLKTADIAAELGTVYVAVQSKPAEETKAEKRTPKKRREKRK